MSILKKSLCVALATAVLFSATACQFSNGNNSSSSSSAVNDGRTVAQPVNDENSTRIIKALREKYKYSQDKVDEIKNIATGVTKPEGSVDVVVSTSAGDVELRLFPEIAPKAVENFITKAKNGEYDNTIFHRVIKDFMIQGGDPEGTGMGGESIWGGYFEDEFSFPYYNFAGALSMANAGQNTNGSQFFIVQAKTDNLNYTFFPENVPETSESSGESSKSSTAQKELNFDRLEEWMLAMNFYEEFNKRQAIIYKDIQAGKPQEEIDALVLKLTEELTAIQEATLSQEMIERYLPVVEYYYTVGGTPHLDNMHTVFGYVINGMDIVDKIANVETDDSDKPKEDVTVKSITVKE